jgi:hypothetical protein
MDAQQDEAAAMLRREFPDYPVAGLPDLRNTDAGALTVAEISNQRLAAIVGLNGQTIPSGAELVVIGFPGFRTWHVEARFAMPDGTPARVPVDRCEQEHEAVRRCAITAAQLADRADDATRAAAELVLADTFAAARELSLRLGWHVDEPTEERSARMVPAA